MWGVRGAGLDTDCGGDYSEVGLSGVTSCWPAQHGVAEEGSM